MILKMYFCCYELILINSLLIFYISIDLLCTVYSVIRCIVNIVLYNNNDFDELLGINDLSLPLVTLI